MVIMASGIARGRVRTTATATVSRNMAAILQIMGWQRHAAWVYCVLLWYWTSKLWSLTPVKTRYLLTVSRDHIAGSSLQLIEVKCFFEVDQVLGSRAHVWLTWWKKARIVRKPVNANTELKVNRSITFSSVYKCFSALFCVYGDYWNSKQWAKQYTENLSAKLQN